MIERESPSMMQAMRHGFLRWSLAGAVFGFAALSVTQHGLAQGLANHRSDAPVDFSADRIELQDKASRVILSGQVDIKQEGLRLRAARTTVAYTNDDGIKIRRIDATGGVTVDQGADSARGDVAVYDLVNNIITMTGNVALRQQGNSLNGGRLVIDLNSGLSSVDGKRSSGVTSSGQGRVSGSFKVDRKP